MNDPLNNLPPFYVGQKVVCVIGHFKGLFKKGEIYTIMAIKKSDCRCGYWVVNIGVTSPFLTTECTQCGMFGIADSMYGSHRFAPIQQQNFPLMTFSEIRKQEEKEVLVDN